MPEPNRHFSIAGFIGLGIWAVFGTWWSATIGAATAFSLHIPLDWLFNEFWNRKRWQTIVLGVAGGLTLIASIVASAIAFKWWAASLMFLASIGMDADDVVPRIRKLILENPKYTWLEPYTRWMPARPIWPCHPGAPSHIKIFGVTIPWHREPWFAEETYWETVMLASFSSILMLAVLYRFFLWHG